MANESLRYDLKKVLDGQHELRYISVKFGGSAHLLAYTILMAFGRTPGNDTAIALQLAKKVHDGAIKFDGSTPVPTFLWEAEDGSVQRLFDRLHQTIPNALRRDSFSYGGFLVREAEIATCIVAAASDIHYKIGRGPTMIGKDRYYAADIRSDIRIHLCQATFNTRSILQP